MGIVTDIEMAAPVRSSEQERGDEDALSVSSRSTQHIGDVVAGDAAARAPPKFRTSRRVTALAFCGVAVRSAPSSVFATSSFSVELNNKSARS